MPNRLTRSKKAKTKIKRPLKPDRVISAKPKKISTNSLIKFKTPKIDNKQLHNYVALIALIIIIVLATGFLFNQYKNTITDLDKANKASDTNKTINANWQMISKIGTDKSLLNSIDNHQSLPDNSLPTVLTVARKAKLKCLSNSDFVASFNFDIKNVVYDNFILAESNCDGKTNFVFANLETGWAVVHQGNSLMECNSVYSLKLPQGVAPYCQTKDVNYLNPNP